MMLSAVGMSEIPARNISPWTTSEKLRRLLWAIVYRFVFRFTFHNWYPLRAAIVRGFGGKLGRNVRFRRTARIEIPWNLDIADDVSIGDEVILYSLGPISIGARTSISQYAHVCAGTHDYTRSDYPLVRPPISIGSDCWIAADAFIGPGVRVGDGAVVGARSVVIKDVPSWMVVAGNPAKPIKQRVLLDRPH